MYNTMNNLKEMTMIILAVATGTTDSYQQRSLNNERELNNIVLYPGTRTIGIKNKKAI